MIDRMYCRNCQEDVTPVIAHIDTRYDDAYYLCPYCGAGECSLESIEKEGDEE